MTKTRTFLSRFFRIGSTLALAATFVFPALSHAATYQYVSTSGAVNSVDAQSSAQAIATAPSISLHSGVMLGTQNMYYGVTPISYTYGQSTQYGYVNSSGQFTVVTANSSSDAFASSVNISENSGVILINSQADANMAGENTSL